jgi:hypothetical protein
MRGLDPAAVWSWCVPIPAIAGSHRRLATSISSGEQRLSPWNFAVDRRGLVSFGHLGSRTFRAVFFSGKVARIGYAPDSVGLYTSLAQSTVIEDVPQRVEGGATCAFPRMDGSQPPVGASGFGMCVGASVDGRKPWASDVRSGAAGRCSDGTAPARGAHRRIRFVGQRMALA